LNIKALCLPAFAQVLALFCYTSFTDPVLETYRHRGSMRNNSALIMETGTLVVDLLFDATILSAQCMAY